MYWYTLKYSLNVFDHLLSDRATILLVLAGNDGSNKFEIELA